MWLFLEARNRSKKGEEKKRKKPRRGRRKNERVWRGVICYDVLALHREGGGLDDVEGVSLLGG